MDTTGTSVSRGSASAMAARSRLRAALMNGVWKAPDTGNGMTFLAPSSRACSRGRRHAGHGAGDDDLAGGVVVGDPDVLVGAAAGDLDLLVVEAEHGGHGARLGQAGVVHRLGPFGHEAHAVVEAEGARWRSGRCTPRGCGRRRSWARCRGAPRRRGPSRLETNVVSWALRVSLQLVGVGVEQQLGDVPLGDLAGLVHQLPALVVEPRAAHAGPLRPLAREHEGEHSGKGRRSDPPATLTGRSPGSPIGRGNGLKIRSVWVRVPPGAPTGGGGWQWPRCSNGTSSCAGCAAGSTRRPGDGGAPACASAATPASARPPS